MAEQSFAELQAQFRSIWPSVTLRSIGDLDRTMVVVHSISFDVPDQLIPVFPAYEERFLCLVLSLLRGPKSRVIYVTSQPVHPRVIDYYFSLVPELDTPEARSRFFQVSLVDGRNEPLSRKLVARPGAIDRIRRLIGQPEMAVIVPFCMTADEVALAEQLQLPIYGCDPALGWLGSKTGSRGVFADEDVRHPTGLDVRDSDDLPAALAELRGRSPAARYAVLKLDEGVSGLGNALLDVGAAVRDLHAAIELEDEEIDLGRVRMAIAFADLAGYTRFTEEEGEEEALSSVERFVEGVTNTLPEDARVVKTIGDAVMVVGQDVRALVDWAVGFTSLFEERPEPRIGIHWGTTLYRDGDYFGRDVNLTSRVVARARGGEVLVTDAVVDAVSDSSHLSFEGIGQVKLKGFDEPRQLCRAIPREE